MVDVEAQIGHKRRRRLHDRPQLVQLSVVNFVELLLLLLLRLLLLLLMLLMLWVRMWVWMIVGSFAAAASFRNDHRLGPDLHASILFF